ncbi:hemolymph lipopolysaccharide-binding protein-like isoform X1 [Nasonia vitripennis]|uniref:C-type lectin domain-containing protein n=1 Tax=Nasonia vitripennis TaxID=7425 RepID=A0A7M7LLA2_NASVI|nr:hemolymph lipopolysaccharide-binding protein-like isoform X1 [Nasonia vitripennis]
MYSYIFLLITLSGILLSSADDGSSVDLKTAPINATNTRSIATYAFESGYKHYPGVGIIKFHHTLADWNEAREICITEGAHLAVIESAYEESIISEHQAINDIVASWIGLHDQFKRESWVGVMDKQIGYAHWNPGEPNNVGGNERCIEYERTGYNDLTCSEKRMFICKINL